MTRVLLTGGSGFIASHILDILIKRGYSVVTTVRSAAKANKIRAAYPHADKSQLDFAIVEDIAEEGAFDEAIISDPPFDAVVHTASPFHFNVKDVEKDLLNPAINGTTGILRSIKRNAPTVTKVIITSSFASIVNPFKGSWAEHTYSEADWNPITNKQATESIVNGYRASKTFAERAAWNFLEQEKPNFTITTLCPPQVFGPVTHHLADLNSLNTSNQVLRDIIQGEARERIPSNATFIWVDVRDLALCHVLALEKSGAANQRFFIAAGFFCNREIVNIIRERFPEYEETLPAVDVSGGDYPETGIYKIDTSRAQDVFGVDWTGLEDTVTDTVRSFQAIHVQEKLQ